MKEIEPGALLETILNDLLGSDEKARPDIIVTKYYTKTQAVTTQRLVDLNQGQKLNLFSTKLFIAPANPISCSDIQGLNDFLDSLTTVPTKENHHKRPFRKDTHELGLGQLQFEDYAGFYDRNLETTLSIPSHLRKYMPSVYPRAISQRGELTHQIRIFAYPHPHVATILGEYHFGYKDSDYADRIYPYDHELEMIDFLNRIRFIEHEATDRGTYPKLPIRSR